jgi:hypothetical protein
MQSEGFELTRCTLPFAGAIMHADLHEVRTGSAGPGPQGRWMQWLIAELGLTGSAC